MKTRASWSIKPEPDLLSDLLLALTPFETLLIGGRDGRRKKKKRERVKMASDLLKAQTSLQNYIFNYIGTLSLKCAVEFDIPSIIHNHGQCGATLFGGMSSLVVVGGNTGAMARAISEAFPHVKCSVLDLAHVVEEAPKDERVEFIAGDTFQHIPPADAVLLELILHDWGDEDCVKILRRCKEAIPAREKGGKVIMIDTVMGSVNSHPKSLETQLCWDIIMMVTFNSAERGEDEWSKIFADAGFSDYKITPTTGLRSIIEICRSTLA